MEIKMEQCCSAIKWPYQFNSLMLKSIITEVLLIQLFFLIIPSVISSQTEAKWNYNIEQELKKELTQKPLLNDVIQKNIDQDGSKWKLPQIESSLKFNAGQFIFFTAGWAGVAAILQWCINQMANPPLSKANFQKNMIQTTAIGGAFGVFWYIIFGSDNTSYEEPQTQKEGWYGIQQGWDYTYPDATVNKEGDMGYELTVSGPTGKCLPGHWYSTTIIESGELPPGLQLYTDPLQIKGIPEERGNWIVTMRTKDIQCEGSTYKDYVQKLIFHIKGSGKVIH
jgi:hypothetical protein